MKLSHRLSVLLLAGLGSFGCAGAHLHHDGNLTLAKQAQAAFEEADLASSVAEERSLFQQTLQSELAVVRRHDRALRDALLITMLNATNEQRDEKFHWPVYLSQRLEERLRDLGFHDLSKLEALQEIEIHIEEQQIAVERRQDQYLSVRKGDDPPGICPFAEQIPTTFSSTNARITFSSFQDACSTLGKLLDKRSELLLQIDGVLGKLGSKIADNERAEEQNRLKLKALSVAYRQAKEAYDSAVEAGKPTGVAKSAEELKKKLEEWLKGAKEIGGPLQLESLIAALDGVQERLNQVLDAIISAGEGGSDSLAPEAEGSLRVLAMLPSIAAQLDDALNLPNVSSLLLEAEHLRLQQEMAQRQLASARLQRELLNRKFEAVFIEADLLQESQEAVMRFREKEDPKTESRVCPQMAAPLVTTFHSSPQACKAEIVRALLAYSNSYDLGRALRNAIDRRLIGAQQVAALDSSEIALAQWDNLIGVPLNQLVAFHSAGIKPEDIGILVQALGLGAISFNLE